jgi:hypothetical protein
MRRWAVVFLLALVGFAGAGCSREPSRAAGRLQVEGGRAEVTEVDGGLATVTRSRTLRSGEQVKIIEGTGTLGLGGGRQLELRRGTVVRLAVQETSAGGTETRGELVTGDVLVVAPESSATVVAGDGTVQVSGAARISRGLAVVTAVYTGAAGLESAGRTVSVPALRQVTLPAPGLPSRATPLIFTAGDPWDQRYLGDAIDLSNQLVARSRGFSAQLAPGEAATPDFFRRILPDLASQPFDAALLDPPRPAGETLVGAAIALESTEGQFANRWASVFSFHDDGAPWGLVALDQGVDRGPLLARVDAAISRVPGLATQAAPPPLAPPTTAPRPASSGSGAVAAPTVPSGGGGTSSGTPAGTASGGGPGTATENGDDGTAASPPATNTTSPTLPHSDRGPVDLGIPLVDDTVNGVVETLSGLLRAIG